jgi:DNA-binding XRE family transcriptional regulator
VAEQSRGPGLNPITQATMDATDSVAMFGDTRVVDMTPWEAREAHQELIRRRDPDAMGEAGQRVAVALAKRAGSLGPGPERSVSLPAEETAARLPESPWLDSGPPLAELVPDLTERTGGAPMEREAEGLVRAIATTTKMDRGDLSDLKLSRMGQRIRRLRTQQGMTQRALAWKARVSPGMIGQLEAGLRQSVDVQIALRIARVLGVTPEALVR